MGADAGGMFELGSDGPSVIVVGLDGTESSMRAAAYAAGLARRQGSRLVAVWVRPEAALTTLFIEAAGALAEAQHELEEELRRSVEGAAAYYGLSGATLVVVTGDPFRELVRVADEVHADVLVVGASTHTGHRLVGSLGVRLVRTGRWPVTVVP